MRYGTRVSSFFLKVPEPERMASNALGFIIREKHPVSRRLNRRRICIDSWLLGVRPTPCRVMKRAFGNQTNHYQLDKASAPNPLRWGGRGLRPFFSSLLDVAGPLTLEPAGNPNPMRNWTPKR